MPLQVRQLKAVKQQLVDANAIPKGLILTNPSVAGDIVCMRQIEYKDAKNVNSMMLHNMKTSTSIHVETPWDLLMPSNGMYVGLEDVRIVWYKDRLMFTATCTHASLSYQSEMVVGMFNEGLNGIERMSYVPFGDPPVKNICPFVVGDDLLLLDIMSLNIHKVQEEVAPEGTWKAYKAVPWKSLSCLKNELRGSTTPVHLHGSTWGCIVHDIVCNNNTITQTVTKLAYFHYWLEFDIDRGVVTYLSSPFFIARFGVEFVSGIAYDKSNQEVQLFQGVDDKTCIIASTSLHELRL